MKRVFLILLVMMLLAGCSSGGETAVTEATQAAQMAQTSQPVEVRTVDELLAAVKPGAVIQLCTGTFDLTEASDYGRETGSPYYCWEETFDGFGLKLKGVQNLTIRGSGQDLTVLAAQSRYADVLTLQNCSDVVLEDFTAGHTEGIGECGGGVLVLEGCLDVDLNRLGLYGCGVTGLEILVSTNVRLTGSEIYECSSSGILAERADGLTVEHCAFHDIGDPTYGGYAVFDLMESDNVSISDCAVVQNSVYYLVHSYPSRNLRIVNSRIGENRIREAAFDLYGESMTFDGNVLENNQLRNWYLPGSSFGVDGGGNLITEEALDEANGTAKETIAYGERREVRVSTVDEFLAAIAPNTQIVLEGAMFDFSQAEDYGMGCSDYYYWEDIFDGPGLVICNVENFGICSADDNRNAYTLAAIPRYANVLTFENAKNISLSGFTAGHTREPGYCTGGVLMFRECDGVQVENCGLYGCGILGVQAEYSAQFRIADCEIYECSFGGIAMYCVNDVAVDNCIFRDLEGPDFSFQECRDVFVDGEPVDGMYMQ